MTAHVVIFLKVWYSLFGSGCRDAPNRVIAQTLIMAISLAFLCFHMLSRDLFGSCKRWSAFTESVAEYTGVIMWGGPLELSHCRCNRQKNLVLSRERLSLVGIHTCNMCRLWFVYGIRRGKE
jgi:hypothetical protein